MKNRPRVGHPTLSFGPADHQNEVVRDRFHAATSMRKDFQATRTIGMDAAR